MIILSFTAIYKKDIYEEDEENRGINHKMHNNIDIVK